MVSGSEHVTVYLFFFLLPTELSLISFSLWASHTVGLLGGVLTSYPGRPERGAEQLDALRQPGLFCGGAEPGCVPERFGHLLLHHQTTSAGPGAAGVVLS